MGGTEQSFLYGGFTVSVGIRAALRMLGTTVSDYPRILDFGCGSARVLRWFKEERGPGRLHGCDIHSAAIDWCKANVDFAEFVTSNPWPPLPYPAHSFDLIFGISVVTHLDEQMQTAWLDELARITTESGVVLLSVHGEDKALKDLAPDEYEQFRNEGFFYRTATERPSVEGLPDFYQVAFHSLDYIQRVWGQRFEVLGYLQHGCTYAQDLVILRPKRSESREPTVLRCDLPIAAFDAPAFGSPVAQSVMEQDFDIAGWAFFPAGGQVTVQIYIDGKQVGECRAETGRRDVFETFYTTPGAEWSGFSKRCSSSRLEKGWHVVWITIAGNPTPLCATIFYIPTSSLQRSAAKAIWEIRCAIRIRTRLRAWRNSQRS